MTQATIPSKHEQLASEKKKLRSEEKFLANDIQKYKKLPSCNAIISATVNNQEISIPRQIFSTEV
jgi:hypothetical protein